MSVSLSGSNSPGTVSVIVVNFNGQNTLLRCLEGLSAQTLPATQVIVVDNASSDKSLESAQQQFPQFEYVCLTKNVGFAAANNLALDHCSTEFVALLNPDAYPEPQWLEELVKSALQNPKAASFGSCQLMEKEPDLLDGVEDVCHISGLVWRDGHGRPRHESDDLPREIFSPCAAAALYRSQAIREVGRFDEDFFCYVEDVDLGFRLRLLGWRSWYVPTAVVRHVGSATTGGLHSDFAMYHGHRNLVWMFVKNMPGYLFWALLPLHIVMNVVGIIWFIFHGRGGTILRAKRDALVGIRNAWSKRGLIQRRRTIPSSAVFLMLNRALFPNRR